MKAAMNKITEGAKLRDTLGRNQCPIITTRGMTASDLISILFNYQTTVSSDNVEKITNVIIIDDNGRGILLKYRGLTLIGLTASDTVTLQNKIKYVVDSKVDEALQKTDDLDNKGDELNDK